MLIEFLMDKNLKYSNGTLESKSKRVKKPNPVKPDFAKTTNGDRITGYFSKDKKTFKDLNGKEYPVNDNKEIIVESNRKTGRKTKVVKESKSGSLMQRLIDAGYPKDQMDHHRSDLYVYVTPLTTDVINKWCKDNGYRMDHFCQVFKDQITGKRMYDCAFQYEDFFDDETKKSDKVKEATSSGKTYRYFNTKFRSLKDELSEFLKESGIYYELSGQTADWHFAILCDEEEEQKVNDWLDKHTVWHIPVQPKDYQL